METIETAETKHPEPDMVLTQAAQYYLQQAGKWASFLGIVGFIITGFIALAAIFAGSIMTYMSRMSPYPSPLNFGPFISVLYLLIALFYFFFSLYLYQFGTRVKRGIAFIDSEQISIGLSKLKSFFKLWGIITIVMLAFYALIIVGVIIVGVTAASLHH